MTVKNTLALPPTVYGIAAPAQVSPEREDETEAPRLFPASLSISNFSLFLSTIVLLPAPPGLQEALINHSPAIYYKPPYVGVRGWIGIELGEISDEELAAHIREAWRLIAPKKSSRRPDLSTPAPGGQKI